MEDKKDKPRDTRQENRTIERDPAPGNKDRDNAVKAHDDAEKDMNADAELSAHSPNDDLDEGETARLGDGDNPIV